MTPIEDYFYDTEFFESGPDHAIEFISGGFKRRRDGALYYCVSDEFDMYRAWHYEGPNSDYWLRENVLKKLPLLTKADGELYVDSRYTPVLDPTHPAVKSRADIRREISFNSSNSGSPATSSGGFGPGTLTTIMWS